MVVGRRRGTAARPNGASGCVAIIVTLWKFSGHILPSMPVGRRLLFRKWDDFQYGGAGAAHRPARGAAPFLQEVDEFSVWRVRSGSSGGASGGAVSSRSGRIFSTEGQERKSPDVADAILNRRNTANWPATRNRSFSMCSRAARRAALLL